MPAQWTADLIGEMHLKHVTKKQLAEFIGVTPEYISMILNGHKEPKGAEDKLKEALRQLIAERNLPDDDQNTTEDVQ